MAYFENKDMINQPTPKPDPDPVPTEEQKKTWTPEFYKADIEQTDQIE